MSPPRLTFVLLTTLGLLHCGGDGPNDPTEVAENPSPSPTPPPTSEPGGPVILSLSPNTGMMTDKDQLVVTALVTDPDGVGDVIGGSLIDSESEQSYGAFATSADEGAYSLTISWEAINTVRAIYTEGEPITRTFTAEFFDVAGHKTTQSFQVTLNCAVAGRYACGGACVDITSNSDHCGGCDSPAVPTPSGDPVVCEGGEPVCWEAGARYCDGECVDYEDSYNCGGCGQTCVLAGLATDEMQCVSDWCRGDVSSNEQKSCDEICSAVDAECGFANSHAAGGTYTDDTGYSRPWQPTECSAIPPSTYGDNAIVSYDIICFCYVEPQ